MKFNLVTLKFASFMVVISVLHFSNAVLLEGDLYFAAATVGNAVISVIHSTVFLLIICLYIYIISGIPAYLDMCVCK